ncbi:MAG TPA: polymer-forming cytoskeletal protein [Albidovulum sp.]|uniref:bactofilin family protein n=1 Tax=Albidovulum sp. TaxID=1872424 RepID=UPI002CD00F5D|nr:polymer-forming cytoskeletal protein [Albidovulum sp.]
MTKSVIEEDLIIDGNITSKDGDIDVKGRVKGDISAKGVSVSSNGEVTGAISAGAVRIQGRHTGQIECTELALEKNAEVKADVKAQTLSSEKGARLVGKVQITG